MTERINFPIPVLRRRAERQIPEPRSGGPIVKDWIYTKTGGTGGGGGGGGAGSWFREIPIGDIDGTNREFLLTYEANPPWMLELILNQTTQYPSANALDEGPITGAQYTIEGNVITYAVAPQPGDVHSALYLKGALAPGPSYPEVILAEPSLVGYYRLEETSGTIAYDSHGTNHGTIVNPANVTQGVASVPGLDNCYTFGGSNGYVSIAQIIGAGDYSVEFWFQTSSIPIGVSNPGAPAESGFGLVNSTNGGADDWGLALARVDGKSLVIGQSGSPPGSTFAGVTSDPAVDLSDGAWHYVVYTHVRATGLSKLYVDGALRGSDTLGTGPQNATATIRFASITFGGGSFLPGKLDEIALYDEALSDSQVAAHLAAAAVAR
jgi:hypothetical protein